MNLERFYYLSSHNLNIVDNALEYAFAYPSQQKVTTIGTLFGLYNAVADYFEM